MKTYKNLYKKLCSFENLCLAFHKARRRKRHKRGVPEFELDLETKLFKIKRELEEQRWRPKPSKEFIVRDPKRRIIYAADFSDRVVHHTLCNIIEPIFDKGFIYDSYACRKGRGNHKAIWRFDRFKRKVSLNNNRPCFVLKMDVRKYFDSLDHEILLSIVRKKIKDEKVMWLIEKIIRDYQTQGRPGKGIPIGNLTSQVFANIYLNNLDHFVKQDLKVKYYLRYMDDAVILSSCIDRLFEIRDAIEEFLRENLDLAIHPKKCYVTKLEEGIDILGYRVFYFYKLLRKGNAARARKRLKVLQAGYRKGDVSLEKVHQSVISWIGHAKHADTYKLRRKVLGEVSFVRPRAVC